MNVDELEMGEKVTLGGALAVVFGALLPWPSAAVGLDGYGLFTLVFALFAAILVAARARERDVHLAVLGLGALTAMVALAALPGASAVADPGAGLYLTVAGGVAVAVGGGLGYATVGAREGTVDPAD